jgi:hypothetical protein
MEERREGALERDFLLLVRLVMHRQMFPSPSVCTERSFLYF